VVSSTFKLHLKGIGHLEVVSGTFKRLLTLSSGLLWASGTFQ